jgi:hypothetical protein
MLQQSLRFYVALCDLFFFRQLNEISTTSLIFAASIEFYPLQQDHFHENSELRTDSFGFDLVKCLSGPRLD